MVAHNGAKYLPETLAALAAQTRPADFHIGVDAGSTDESASILQLELPAGSPVVSAAPRAGLGNSASVGVAQIPDIGGGTADRSREWLWLLHDDSAPAPDALEELLLAIERAPSVTVAGCKQVEWDQPRKLVDVGLSISRWAERVTLIDFDELDQGQHDGRDDMFAVNSAGMLVRRDVWDALGGFDPALPGVGDDVDFCWRNRLAGNRVVVVPRAVLRHVTDRPGGQATQMGYRASEVFLRLKHAPLWQVPFLAVGAVLGGIFRFFVGVLAKDPGYGAGQLAASVSAVARPIDLARSRRQAQRTRAVARGKVNALRTRRRDVWAHRRSVLEASADHVVGDGTGADAQAYIPSGDAADDFASLAAPPRAWVGVGAIAAVLILGAVSLVGLNRFLGADALAGGGLLPLSASPAEIWHNATSWWIGLGSGYPGHGDPFGYVLWLLSLFGFGNGTAAVQWLILLAMPLAGLSAWLAGGALTTRRALRFWAAIFWAAVPALQVALGSGRLGALLVHILLPLVVLGLLRSVGAAIGARPIMTTAEAGSAGFVAIGTAGGPAAEEQLVLKPGINGVPSWTAAAATGLVLAMTVAAAPSLFPLAVVAVAVLTLVLRRRAKTLWWSLLPALALFIPFAVSTGGRLRALAADPGVPLPFEAAELWQQVLGYPVSFPWSAPLAAAPFLGQGPWPLAAALIGGGPVLLLAVAALFLRGRRWLLVRFAWGMGLLALLLSAGSAFVGTAVGAGSLVTPFTGPLVSAFVFMMLIAAVLGAERLLYPKAASGGKPRTAPRVAAVLAAVVLAAGPVANLALWLAPQLTGTTAAPAGENADGAPTLLGADMQLRDSAARTLPATATDRGYSDERTKALVLRVDGNGELAAAVMHSGGTTLDQLSTIYAARTIMGPLGAEEIREDDGAAAAAREAVAVVAAGSGVDPRPLLGELGVGYLVLQESDTAAELLASRIDSVPGLAAIGRTDAGWLWRVMGPTAADGTEERNALTARVRIVDPEGVTASAVASGPRDVDAQIPAGAPGRMVVLAERADLDWQATLDGKPLAPAESGSGWMQAFELPAEGGQLEIGYRNAWEPWTQVVQLVVIGLTLLLAIPMPARRRMVALETRRAAAPKAVGSRTSRRRSVDRKRRGKAAGGEKAARPESARPDAATPAEAQASATSSTATTAEDN